jgi:hypothetical protein
VDIGRSKERDDGELNKEVWNGGHGQCAFDKKDEQVFCCCLNAQVAGDEDEGGYQAKEIGVRRQCQKLEMERGGTRTW